MRRILLGAGLLAMSATAAQSAAPLEKHMAGGYFAYSSDLDARAQLHRELWEAARTWAEDTQKSVSDCAVQLRVDQRTLMFRSWYVECTRPWENPYSELKSSTGVVDYSDDKNKGDAAPSSKDEPGKSPDPEPDSSRPAATMFSLDDIRAFGRTLKLWSEASDASEGKESVWTDCWINVGFSKEGIAAETMECSLSKDETRMAVSRGSGSGWTVLPGSTKFSKVLLEDDRTEKIWGCVGRGIYEFTWLHSTDGRTIEPDWFVLETMKAMRTGRAKETPAARPNEIPFTVTGEVVDREEHAVRLWGKALPPGNWNPLGALYRDANILVLYPAQSALKGPIYIPSHYCFVGKQTGTNRFGAAIPVWVYGPCPLPAGTSWAFLSKASGEETVLHGPFKTYPACDSARAQSSARGLARRCYQVPDDIIRKHKGHTSPR